MTRQSRPQSGLSNTSNIWQMGTWFTTMTGVITITANPTLAQSISIDGSTNTLLNNNTSCSGTCTITGGTLSPGSQSNLFHSFSNFNVDANETVTFEPDPGINSIFSRITGNSLTNIDGTLKVDGSADLYLLNSNGIVFGQGARLEIPGSFLATTAQSVLFESEQAFSTTNTDNPALLSVNVPLGLQFGANPSSIVVSGNQHALAYNPVSSTITRNTPSTGLISTPGQTLALLGGDVSLQGGNLIAQNGSVQIGSIGSNETVTLETESNGWTFDYSTVTDFQNVSLTNQSSIDVSDNDAGNIQINAQNINISEGSAILAQIENDGTGSIALNASNDINVVGESISATQPMLTGAFIEIANGATGNGSSSLMINANNSINLSQVGQIGLGMAGEGTSGTVEFTAPTINVDGGDAANPTSIYAAVLPAYRLGGAAVGQGGDLTINADQLNVTGGAQITTSTFDGGNAGDLTVNAKDIQVIGRSSSANVNAVSSIRSASEIPPLGFVLDSSGNPRFPSVAEGSGNSGTITLNTERLLVADTAQVGVSTFSNNVGGSLIVNASDSIELRGGDSNGRSGLFASALGDRRVPINSTGTGGSIRINTQQLNVLDGATINVSTSPSETLTAGNGIQSEGTAGDIDITATDINIKDGSFITADTVAGDRANINIQSDSLVLREGGSITTNATGTATGGNININTEALIAFENSDITANAVDNFGGRIVINAPTILGTTFREQLTSESDITATSELGPAFSGSVELNSPEIDPTDGTVELPEGLNAEDQIVAACEKLDSNTFIATGRGGLPEGSGQIATGQSLWNDFRLLENNSLMGNTKSEHGEIALSSASEATAHQPEIIERTEIVEAQDWGIDNEGKIILGTRTSLTASAHSNVGCLQA